MRKSGRRLDGLARGLCMVAATLLLSAAPGRVRAEEAGADRPLVFGTWQIGPEAMVDGDTLRIPNAPSVRVMCIDTEETFKSDTARASARADFDAYAKAKRGDAPRPVKFGTPLGEAARTFAAGLVEHATAVRLERDSIGGREIDPYGRRLAHVVLECPKGDINLALELIRAGYSPYFVKYGRSRRHDKALRAAEAQAKKAALGVWGTKGPRHYPDYDERLRWWHERAGQVEQWRAEESSPVRIMLGTVLTRAALKAQVGKEVVVFGLLSRMIETKDKTKTILFLGDRPRRGFPLVLFDKTLSDAWDMARVNSMYITVRGKLSLYRGEPQMVIERADQLSTDDD